MLKSLITLLATAKHTGVSSYDIPLVNAASTFHDGDQCTAILVSKEGAADGVGSMTTHTNDCLDCDFRIVKVPAADHPAGSARPIIGGRAQVSLVAMKCAKWLHTVTSTTKLTQPNPTH